MNMQYFSTFELRALRFQCMHELGNKVDSPVPRALETTIFFSLSRTRSLDLLCRIDRLETERIL